MLKILIPLGGKSSFFDSSEYQFPKPLIEIRGKSMIQLVIENLNSIQEEKKFIFILNELACVQYHLDDVLRLLTDDKCEIILLKKDTKGAACSCLMAIDSIDNSEELIIANGDQIIDVNLNRVLEEFRKKLLEGAVICFESVHPKWSFVRLDQKENIVETAEKRPISKNAIAGFYYFKNGSDFIKSAMNCIKKDANVNNMYYIAPTYNEMVLENKRLGIYKMEGKNYHSFYSPQKIQEYEHQI